MAPGELGPDQPGAGADAVDPEAAATDTEAGPGSPAADVARWDEQEPGSLLAKWDAIVAGRETPALIGESTLRGETSAEQFDPEWRNESAEVRAEIADWLGEPVRARHFGKGLTSSFNGSVETRDRIVFVKTSLPGYEHYITEQAGDESGLPDSFPRPALLGHGVARDGTAWIAHTLLEGADAATRLSADVRAGEPVGELISLLKAANIPVTELNDPGRYPDLGSMLASRFAGRWSELQQQPETFAVRGRITAEEAEFLQAQAPHLDSIVTEFLLPVLDNSHVGHRDPHTGNAFLATDAKHKLLDGIYGKAPPWLNAAVMFGEAESTGLVTDDDLDRAVAELSGPPGLSLAYCAGVVGFRIALAHNMVDVQEEDDAPVLYGGPMFLDSHVSRLMTLWKRHGSAFS